jgi:hypothetical protein
MAEKTRRFTRFLRRFPVSPIQKCPTQRFPVYLQFTAHI